MADPWQEAAAPLLNDAAKHAEAQVKCEEAQQCLNLVVKYLQERHEMVRAEAALARVQAVAAADACATLRGVVQQLRGELQQWREAATETARLSARWAPLEGAKRQPGSAADAAPGGGEREGGGGDRSDLSASPAAQQAGLAAMSRARELTLREAYWQKLVRLKEHKALRARIAELERAQDEARQQRELQRAEREALLADNERLRQQVAQLSGATGLCPQQPAAAEPLAQSNELALCQAVRCVARGDDLHPHLLQRLSENGVCSLAELADAVQELRARAARGLAEGLAGVGAPDRRPLEIRLHHRSGAGLSDR